MTKKRKREGNPLDPGVWEAMSHDLQEVVRKLIPQSSAPDGTNDALLYAILQDLKAIRGLLREVAENTKKSADPILKYPSVPPSTTPALPNVFPNTYPYPYVTYNVAND